MNSHNALASKYRPYRDQADSLGQFFTPPVFADRLIANVGEAMNAAPRILDLGAGHGALTSAAFRARPASSAQMVEIDPQRVLELEHLSQGRWRVVEADALQLPTERFDPTDLVLSNPPFGHSRLDKEAIALICRGGLVPPSVGGWMRTDAAFVAKAWSLIKSGAAVGFITASPIMTDPSFRNFRAHLLTRLRGAIATRLPSATFPGVEVSAFALTGQRAVSRNRGVVLQSVDVNGEIEREIEVSINDAINSLDINYHLALKDLRLESRHALKTLRSVGCTVRRGSRSQAEYRKLGLQAFHTSSFDSPRTGVTLRGARSGYNVAAVGDILVARVGTRCLDRHAQVVKGAGLFTDCVYRLAAPERHRSEVWKTLSSGFGIEWRLANAQGSCAKYITVEALLGMPINWR